MPEAVARFDALLAIALRQGEEPPSRAVEQYRGDAEAKDVPVLAAAAANGAAYLVTGNARHFNTSRQRPRIVTPGDLLTQIRQHVAQLPSRFDGPGLA